MQSIAHKMRKGYQDFLDLAMDAVVNKIALTIIQSTVNFEGKHFNIQDEKGAMYLVNKILQPQKGYNGLQP